MFRLIRLYKVVLDLVYSIDQGLVQIRKVPYCIYFVQIFPLPGKQSFGILSGWYFKVTHFHSKLLELQHGIQN